MEHQSQKDSRKRLVTLVPVAIFIVIMIASIILGLAASKGQSSLTAISTNQSQATIRVIVVISGNTTYTTTVTCSRSPIVIIQPEVIEEGSTNITTTTAYTTETTVC